MPLTQAPPVIESAAPSAVGTGGGCQLPRLIVNGTVVGGQAVDVAITGGSATLGTDFTLTTTITIPAGTYDGTAGTSIEIPLAILSDFDSESTEDIQLTLLHPTTGVSLGDANGNAPRRRRPTPSIANVAEVTPPTVTTTSFDATDVAVNATSLTVSFSVNSRGQNVTGNYYLQRAGTDFVLGTADDVTVPITSAMVAIGTATLVSRRSRPTCTSWALTVKDVITDTVGRFLDGDADGVIGGNNVHRLAGTPTNVAIRPSLSGHPRDRRRYSAIADTDFVSISQGGSHTLGLKTDGTVWPGGNNNEVRQAMARRPPAALRPSLGIGCCHRNRER
ncbi:MAG: RCC1 domain-containing protein [Planctomycetaceae bacterium]